MMRRFGLGGLGVSETLRFDRTGTERNPLRLLDLRFPASLRRRIGQSLRNRKVAWTGPKPPPRLVRMHPPPPAHEKARARFPRPGPSRVVDPPRVTPPGTHKPPALVPAHPAARDASPADRLFGSVRVSSQSARRQSRPTRVSGCNAPAIAPALPVPRRRPGPRSP